MAEKRAETFHRLSGSLHGTESSGSDKPLLNHVCRPARIGKLKGRHARQTPLLNVSHTSTQPSWTPQARVTASVVFFSAQSQAPSRPAEQEDHPPLPRRAAQAQPGGAGPAAPHRSFHRASVHPPRDAARRRIQEVPIAAGQGDLVRPRLGPTAARM